MVVFRLLLLLLVVPLVGAAEDAPDSGSMRLELVLDTQDRRPFEREMILATIRGTFYVRVADEELKLRPMSDFDWIRLAQDHWEERRIDGRNALTFERRIALFPKRAGTLEILPIAQEVEYLAEDGRHTVILRSDPVTVEVAAKPQGAGDLWLPVRAMELSETWSADAGRLIDGESAMRRVVLRVFGTMPELLPTQPPMRQPWLITFAPPEVRSVQVTPEGPISTAIWTWTMRPITGEPGVLPEVSIPYYDTTEDRARAAVIPAAPIGYASFAAGEGRWSDHVETGFGAAAAFGAGGVIAMAVALWDRAVSRRGVERLRRRWRRRKLRADMIRQARCGDARAFRAAAARLIAASDAEPYVAVPALLRPVDDYLFGTAPDMDGAPLMAVAREVARHVDGGPPS